MKKFVLLFIFLCAGSVNATIIDFTVFPSGETTSTTLVTPEATFNSFGRSFFVGAAGFRSEICAVSNQGCGTDFEAIFIAEIENLTLVTTGFHSGDTVEISAFDISNTLLGSVVQAANGLVDLTAFTGVNRILFDDSSGRGFGFAYDAITFDFVSNNNIPEPATIALLALGLASIGFSRKKKTT